MALRSSTNRIVSSSRLRRKRRKIWTWVIVILILGALGYGIYGNVLDVRAVVVEGNKHTDASEIQKVADEFLVQYRWYIFPQRNVVFFPTRKFKKEMVRVVPGVETVSVDFNIQDAMTVSVTDRKATGIWCNEGEECFFFDNEGLIFKPSFVFTGSIYTVWFEEGKQVGLGEKVSCLPICTNQAYVNFLVDHKIKSADMTGGDTHVLTSLHGYQIKASNDPLVTIKHMAMLQKKNVALETLDYIDVRFSNKIFYK